MYTEFVPLFQSQRIVYCNVLHVLVVQLICNTYACRQYTEYTCQTLMHVH